ncbi:MAG: hypothetical protein KJZ86_17505 [Caldilineaceae bacterium]|nr:hypothetical protein [Caldilineaceae bacterium]
MITKVIQKNSNLTNQLLLVQMIPWAAGLGLLLIYAGLKLLSVTLPF